MKYKHHVMKVFIALIIIPALTTLLDTYIVSEDIPFLLSAFLSFGIAYLVITVYDSTVVRESKKDTPQVIKNTLDIKYTQEDVRVLQELVHREEMEEIRLANARRVMRRKRVGGK